MAKRSRPTMPGSRFALNQGHCSHPNVAGSPEPSAPRKSRRTMLYDFIAIPDAEVPQGGCVFHAASLNACRFSPMNRTWCGT